MTTTLASLGIDPSNSPYRSADLLLAGQLTALYEYAKSLEERVNLSQQSPTIAELREAIQKGADQMFTDLSQQNLP